MLLVNGRKKDNLPKMAKAVQFELLGCSHEDPRIIDAKSGKPRVRKNLIFRLPTSYVRFNKETNQNEEFRYAIQEIPIKTGKDEGSKRYTPDKIVFTSGTLIVRQEHPDLYEFLRNSPWTEKEGNLKPLFREVNPLGDSQERITKEKQLNRAKRMILDDEVVPEITLRRVLASTGDNGDYDIDIVRDRLLTIAEKDPVGFVKMIGSKDTELKALITDLCDKNIIGFNPDKKQWQWGEKTKDSGNQIVACPAGKNETDWLIDTLLREEQILKSFKLLANAKEDAPDKSDERKKLEEKAKKLKCAQGMSFMSDENLDKKINTTIELLKKELDDEKTKDFRKKKIEEMLESAGVLVNS
jgi:hypothetical protein